MDYIIPLCFFGVIAAAIANGKGNSGLGGFLLGFFLGPIGLLITIISRGNNRPTYNKSWDTKKCPYCAEFVKKEAVVCRYCGGTLDNKDYDDNFDINQFRS